MQKVINNKTIYFYDDEGEEIMHINYSTDECIWHFCTSNIINITNDMELYKLLNNFMNNSYAFSENILTNYKDENHLIWYSDCYYNPDDEWSIASVSCLHIERKDDQFKVWCSKKLDEIIDRSHKTYGVCFSPLGNGQYSKNLETGLTLQDDFISYLYQPLLNINKVLKKQIN